jgi:hypothetical protein
MTTQTRRALAALALAAVVTLSLVDPATTWWMPSCPLYALTGWLCPLCGSLRALHALLRGAPLAALAFNPLIIVALPWALIARRRAADFCFSARGLTALAAFGLVRNLPSYTAWLGH